MAGVVALAYEEVVFVNHVGDEYVQPAVVVDVGAGDGGGGAQVGAVGEGGVGDVAERAVAVVDEQPVGIRGRDGLAVLSDDMSGAEIQAVALYAARADVEVLVAVVVQVAGDNAARTLLDRRDARGFGGLHEGHVAVVAEEAVGVARLLGEVDVLVAVAVVVEDGDARAVVGDAVRAAQGFPGDVGERGYGAFGFGGRSGVRVRGSRRAPRRAG